MNFNLAVILRETALAAPDRPAILYPGGSLTYAELDELSALVAASLQASGIAPGDAVALQLPNIPEFVVAYFGILKAGGVAVPLNTLLKAPEVAFLLGDCAAKILITWDAVRDDALAGAASAGLSEVYAVGGIDDERVIPFSRLLAAPAASSQLAAREPDDTAVIMYTSGTTGQPKGAELTHLQLYMNADIPGRLFDVRPDDVVITVLPLFHVFGLSSILDVCVRFGCTMSLISRFDPAVVLGTIQRDRATILEGVPAMFIGLLSYPDLDDYDTSSLRVAISGGASIPADVLDGFEKRFGIPILEGYGLTETASTVTFSKSVSDRAVDRRAEPRQGGDGTAAVMTAALGQPIPRLEQDYTRAAAGRRLAFLGDATGTRLAHVGQYSIDPGAVDGNVENFIGAAQVPLGIAGPLLVDGEHARGEFYVPLATTEGALVASYNRGMKLLYRAGGVKATVMDDRMQRAPAFGFDSAREARDFGRWVTANFYAIKQAADATTRIGHLHDIQQFSASRFIFLRFNYTTGDAAGQNMTGKATARACGWIRDRYPGVRQFCLESNLSTDKKSSQINILATRGKRVTAEATIPAGLISEVLHTTPEEMFRARQLSNLGGLLAGVHNNGNHSANGIAALFVATGQDIANVAESSAALVHSELLGDGSYYYSITIPALIVATYGGGTGLPTQRECLQLLGCYGTGQVGKFAEIVAATVLCGELSLGSAVVAEEWVGAHERLGRNRPEQPR